MSSRRSRPRWRSPLLSCAGSSRQKRSISFATKPSCQMRIARVDHGDAIAARGLRFLDDAAIGRGQRRNADQRAGQRHAAAFEPLTSRRRPLGEEQRPHAEDRFGEPARHRKAIGRIGDGWREHVGERPAAVLAQQRHPARECAWHGGGEQADAGHLLHAEPPIGGRRGVGRRAALAVDGAQLLRVLGPVQHRHFAARAVEMRLDDLQREAAGHRRIEGVAAALEHAHRHLRGDPVRRGGDAEGAGDFRAGGEHRKTRRRE